MLTLKLAGGKSVTVPYARVGGWGPTPARVMCIGDSPGVAEGQRGRPFAGKAGGEFRRFLNGYTLPESHELYLTNLSRDVRADLSTWALSDDDERELWEEITAVHPEMIVTLGAYATRYFLGPDATLEMTHAIPHPTERHLDWWNAAGYQQPPMIFPSYSPSAMLHSPSLQAVFAYTMQTLGLYLKGKLKAPPQDVFASYYRRLTDPAEVLRELTATRSIGADTEGWAHNPWCVSAASVRGAAVVVKAGDREALRAVQTAFNAADEIVLHNSLHDLNVLEALELEVPEGKLRDTMIAAYLLGLEPQGLKPLAYRHAGMLMQEYSELTAEAAISRALIWLLELHDRLPDKPVTLKKSEAVACGLWPEKGGGKYVPVTIGELVGDDVERARAKGLIARMLEKDPATLRKRWADSTAREILAEELQDLPPWAADPPEPTLDEVPEAKAVPYAGRDADATLRIKDHLHAEIKAYGLQEVYETDLGIVPMINRMQTVGIGVDLPHFANLTELFQLEAQINLDALEEMTGRPINPNSGDQVAAWLYDTLHLDQQAPNLRIRRTDGGRLTTNDKTLEALSGLHPSVGLIQEGREIRKLIGTYTTQIPLLIGKDGRLHPRYRITRTDTGRLSAGDPNILALPKHSYRGGLVRNGFVAGEGRELGEWDLAQIEMCVFAHDSQDPVMMDIICRGVDLHRETASMLFGKLADLITKEERFAAKAINFGILMGITAIGLRDQFHKNGQTHWTEEMCQDLLLEWRRVYKKGWEYIQSKHAEARRYGFVRDMWGRLRWLEGVHAADDRLRAEAERQAQATPTQSGAQGIIKRVMKAVWPTLRSLRRDFWIEPLLQVHDALVLEYDRNTRDFVTTIMEQAMTDTVHLSVPIRSSASFGLRLGDL